MPATTERLFGNGNGNGKKWEKPSGNRMGMGIGYKIGNGNGKEWECKKPFPVIFSLHRSITSQWVVNAIDCKCNRCRQGAVS